MLYGEVVKNGWILPKKKFYTIRDYRKLLEQGHNPKTARFIVICSAVYHDTDCTKIFYSYIKFFRKYAIA